MARVPRGDSSDTPAHRAKRNQSAKSAFPSRSGRLGFRPIKSTIPGLRPGRQMRGSIAPACRSELRYGGSPSTC
jgi:hypothetical protein